MARRIFKSLLSVFLAVFMMVSVAVIPSNAAVALSKSSITLTKGYQTTLSVTGTSKAVTWSTGDKSIATVSTSGTVVGKAPGTTYVYANVGGSTYKCKVTVVAAKITSSTSSVTFSKRGETKTITINVKGSHSGLTVGTDNKSVAIASWVKPVKWDGDKISYIITAQQPGTARIKAYLKDYPNTCYHAITVQVGSNSSSSGSSGSSSSNKMTILTNPKTSVDVAAGGTATVQVYCTYHSRLMYSIANTSIATASAGNVTGLYRDFTINGIREGQTVIRFYDKNDSSVYYDVMINVGGSSYYELYTTKPTKINAATDKIMTIQLSATSTYYMLVPENYDPAYANSIVAKRFNVYPYYQIYTEKPLVNNSTETYHEFYNTNPKYSYGTRYILLPKDYDKIRYQTAMAQYLGYFEYWTVYSVSPTKILSNDIIVDWTVVDQDSGKSTHRYLLVPAYEYDLDRINKIKENDISDNTPYNYYIGYSTWPSINEKTDKLITYNKNNSIKYMVVPKDDSGIAKANDAISKDTGMYEYNVLYSVQPTVGEGEKMVSVQHGTNYYYVLLKTSDKTPDKNIATRYANGYKDD